ncbi:MAG: HNH endonuclease [Pleurocapsa minor GSE-CHR-MK-17-07R]|jgi:hypothetical protein|nr:HNH endonuclease [Pleurocapsa minor GSE-CHR-MK 17-07R]
MFEPGQIISYDELAAEEGSRLQAGMNFRCKPFGRTILLSSLRPNAPYRDAELDGGKIVLYEGHDLRSDFSSSDPKRENQPMSFPGGSLTQNGLFYQAAHDYKEGRAPAEIVRLYEKLKPGIWEFNGLFDLVDAWTESDGTRIVFKFKLVFKEEQVGSSQLLELQHSRMIPASVKLEVWKRDDGKCQKCGSTVNLHFDHIIPYSMGGTSLTAQNIQLLCAKHNLEKRARLDG